MFTYDEIQAFCFQYLPVIILVTSVLFLDEWGPHTAVFLEMSPRLSSILFILKLQANSLSCLFVKK